MSIHQVTGMCMCTRSCNKSSAHECRPTCLSRIIDWCCLPQETGMTAAGMDISDPSKFSEGDWEGICSLPLIQLTGPPRKMVANCSVNFGNLLTASDTKCGHVTTIRSPFGNMTEQTISPEKVDAAVCGAVEAMVGVHLSRQILRPKTKLTSFYQLWHHNNPMYCMHCTGTRPYCCGRRRLFRAFENPELGRCMRPVVDDTL